MLNAYNSVAQAMGPHAQADALRGMQGDVMGAYARENQSRVIQERERKQREHEKEMERMRLDALMKRLSQASGPQANGRMPKASGPGFAIY